MAETTVRRPSSGDESLSFDVSFDEYLKFANAYHTDAALRVETDADPAAALSRVGFDLPPGVKPQVALNTDEIFHVVFPPDPNVAPRGRGARCRRGRQLRRDREFRRLRGHGEFPSELRLQCQQRRYGWHGGLRKLSNPL